MERTSCISKGPGVGETGTLQEQQRPAGRGQRAEGGTEVKDQRGRGQIRSAASQGPTGGPVCGIRFRRTQRDAGASSRAHESRRERHFPALLRELLRQRRVSKAGCTPRK